MAHGSVWPFGSLDGITTPDPSVPLDRWFGPTASSQRTACEAWLRACDPAGYKTAYQVFAHEDGPKNAMLAALRCRALFMTGADEPNSTPQMSCDMAALTPNGQAVVIDGAAHMMPMTHASQVNAALSGFVGDCLQ